MNTSLELYNRAMYILTEAKRVQDFQAVCENTNMSEDEKLQKLGQIMVAGQKSSNEQFDNSSEELEELTGLAVKSGALGSKSSGAGWGGCCVSLVHKDNLSKVMDSMKTYYSKERPEEK